MVQITTLPSTPLASGKELGLASNLEITSGAGQGRVLTADLADNAAGLLVDPDRANGVLVNGIELGVILRLTPEIHLPEQVERRLLTGTAYVGAFLGFDRPHQLPTALIPAEAISLAVLKAKSYGQCQRSRRL
jgi:hypothetical protein